jgi:cytochrome c oxidase subunit IV
MDASAHTQSDNSKVIWRTFWILLGITMVELVLAFLHLYAGFLPKFILNGLFLILTLAKAFYIVAEFMHLRHELKNLIMTVVVPMTIFIWFILAFLWEGSSYRNLRDTHNKQLVVPAKKAPVQEGTHEGSSEHH